MTAYARAMPKMQYAIEAGQELYSGRTAERYFNQYQTRGGEAMEKKMFMRVDEVAEVLDPCYVAGILCASAYMIFIALFNQITSMHHQTSPALLTTLGTYLQIAALILIMIQTIMLLKKRQSML